MINLGSVNQGEIAPQPVLQLAMTKIGIMPAIVQCSYLPLGPTLPPRDYRWPVSVTVTPCKESAVGGREGSQCCRIDPQVTVSVHLTDPTIEFGQ